MKRKAASIAVGLALSAGFLALALRNVRLDELAHALAQARWAWIPVMLAVSALDLVVRAARWRILLKRGRPKLWDLIRFETIGLAVNNVLFMRLGELARSFLAARGLSLPFLTVLASVAVERALDVASLLTLFLLAGWLQPALVPTALLKAAAAAWAGALSALALLALAEKPLSPGGSWERRLKRWPRLHGVVASLAAGAAILREPRAALSAGFLGLLLWAIDASFYWAGARALGLESLVDYPRSVLVLSWAAAGAFLPAAPGAFGTFEAMVKAILERFGAEPAQALAFAVFNHMTGYLFVTAAGLFFLYRVGLSLAELRSQLEKRK